jgi:hypothetical protein
MLVTRCWRVNFQKDFTHRISENTILMVVQLEFYLESIVRQQPGFQQEPLIIRSWLDGA